MKSMSVILFNSFSLITSPFSLLKRYNDQHAKLAAYLTWPDARLRAYLREKGVSEEYIPGDRPNLLRTLATWYLKCYDLLTSCLQKKHVSAGSKPKTVLKLSSPR